MKVLSRSGKAEELTNPHRPYGSNKSSLEEIRRIREAGGWVCFLLFLILFLTCIVCLVFVTFPNFLLYGKENQYLLQKKMIEKSMNP